MHFLLLQDLVADAELGFFKKDWRDAFLAGEENMKAYIQRTQCEACKEARRCRQRVLHADEEVPTEIHQEPMHSAILQRLRHPRSRGQDRVASSITRSIRAHGYMA